MNGQHTKKKVAKIIRKEEAAAAPLRRSKVYLCVKLGADSDQRQGCATEPCVWDALAEG